MGQGHGRQRSFRRASDQTPSSRCVVASCCSARRSTASIRTLAFCAGVKVTKFDYDTGKQYNDEDDGDDYQGGDDVGYETHEEIVAYIPTTTESDL